MKPANRVVVNTTVNYIQLFINMLIGLFTVRILLESLGIVDYGIYNLIGGVITIITFVSSSLSQTSIRFISVSLGKKDLNETRKTFSACFTLHFYLAAVLAGILEIAGIFLFDGFLNIPVERIRAAELVFHCMVFTLFSQIVSTPFSALLVANEKFILLSIDGITVSVLKLLIALYVSYSLYDKLLTYGLLMMFVVVVDFVLYIVFCLQFRKMLSLQIAGFKRIRPIVGFAGWTLLDVMSTMANREGYAIMLNKFFGPVINSVYAIAGQISGCLFPISSSIINTIKPQIMKSYGAGERERALRLSLTAGKFGFSLMSLIAIPLIVMMPDILVLWIKEVPYGTIFFARIKVISNMVEQLTRGLVHANQAEGNIKWFIIITSTIRMSALPISCFFLLLGASAYTSIVIFLICESAASLARVFVMVNISDLKIETFVGDVVFRIIPPFLIALVICNVGYTLLSGIIGIILVSAMTILCYSILLFVMGFTKEEKLSITHVAASVRYKLLEYLHK